MEVVQLLSLGLTLTALACGPPPIGSTDAGGGSSDSTGTAGGSSGGTEATTSGGSSGGGTGSSTSGGGSSGTSTGSAASSGGAAGLAGTLGFTVVFEGEFNHHFPDGGPDTASLVAFFSDFDFSPYCPPNPDGGNIYLPNPVGAQIAILTFNGDGDLAAGTYPFSSTNVEGILQGDPGIVVTAGVANQPDDVSNAGSVTLQALQGTLASGYFHATLVDADGGLAGTLSGSFSANPCPGAAYWH